MPTSIRSSVAAFSNDSKWWRFRWSAEPRSYKSWYQDTNALQAQILLHMRPEGRGLAVVGDDAQSIYSFRAATVRNILDFPNQFTPPAHVVTLQQNYRSTEPILKACNA